MNPARLSRACALSFTLFAACGCGHRNAPADSAPARALPPPPRPDDVLVSAHFGQPRTTVDALSQLTGSRIPFELGLALVLGVEGTVLAASDTSQPIDVFVTGTVDHPSVVFVLTPSAAQPFRNTLSSRFRFVRVETLGERLDPQNASGPVRGTRCAVVGVPGPLPSRIVCANRLEALEHAGRFAAYESQRLAAEHGDVIVDVDGATARTALGPMAQRAVDENNQSLAASAAEERRRHEHAPELGDPERALDALTSTARSLVHELDDVRHLTLRGSVSADAFTVSTDLTLDAQGHGTFVSDALSRVGIDTSHPLASRLAPDAFAAFASRSRTDNRGPMIDSLVQTVLGVLGSRVSEPEAARTNVDALFAQLGEESAIGVANEPEGGFEVTAVFSQRDDGTAARTALDGLSRAAWLRTLRLGDMGLVSTFANGVLTLRPQSTPQSGTARNARPASATATTATRGDAGTPAPAPGSAAAGGSTTPPAIAISAIGNVLVFVVGHHVDAALAAITARSTGPVPAVFGTLQGSALIGADLSAFLRTSGNEHPVLRGAYTAERTGNDVIGHARFDLPPAILRGALHDALQPSR